MRFYEVAFRDYGTTQNLLLRTAQEARKLYNMMEHVDKPILHRFTKEESVENAERWCNNSLFYLEMHDITL